VVLEPHKNEDIQIRRDEHPLLKLENKRQSVFKIRKKKKKLE